MVQDVAGLRQSMVGVVLPWPVTGFPERAQSPFPCLSTPDCDGSRTAVTPRRYEALLVDPIRGFSLAAPVNGEGDPEIVKVMLNRDGGIAWLMCRREILANRMRRNLDHIQCIGRRQRDASVGVIGRDGP